MKTQQAVRRLIERYTEINDLTITYNGDPVDVLEACDPSGFLILLADQAQTLSECTDHRNEWMRGLKIVPDAHSLTGKRVELDDAAIRDRVSFLLFMLEAMVLATEHAPAPNQMDLGSIAPPRMPRTFMHLGLNQGAQLLAAFEEPPRMRPEPE